MMWSNNSWGPGWGWVLLMAAAMVVCMVVMGRMMIRHGGPWNMWSAGGREEEAPERILARRLAGGEIDVQEFERLRTALWRTSNPPTEAADASHPDDASREAGPRKRL
jgi:uncharacterized membrane protein